MTHNTRRIKIFTLALGLTMCLAVILGITSVNPQTAKADTTTIDTLEVAFRKVNVGDSLAAAFEFEDETAKTLKVPVGANYTATLLFVSKNGQARTLWEKDKESFPWSNVENQPVEQKVAYCIRVRFALKENYKLSKDVDTLKKKLKVSGAELGKGKDVEIWDVAGQFSDLTAVDMDFIISRGLTYLGYRQTIYPKIDEEVTGKIGTLYTGTGIWLRGAPGPYAYTVKAAPVGTKLDKHDGFNDDESTCYYQIIAKNAMDGGTMYVTATAADGQTCDIPVTIAAVSGGHEHTWVEKIEKIDYEHHGYTKCTDPACPGVAPAFDKGSQYASHEFYSGCNAKCKMCGDLGNPDTKHNFTAAPDESDGTCHVFKCACGEVKRDESGNIIKEKHSGGIQTCLSGAKCDVCGAEYLAATGHKYEFRSFRNNDGTYMHLGFCKYCGKENTDLRHSPKGGAATCQERAKCDYIFNGDVCGCEYGEFKAHNFVGGICTECSSGEYIREVEIDVPEFYKGMAYSPLFYPNVIKGNVIPKGDIYYKASLDRDGNGYLCNAADCGEVKITNNSVMLYAFKPHTTCKFPESVDDLNVTVTNGELLSKQIRENDGSLVILVLLRVENAVQSLDIEVSQPLAGNLPETLKITEKNGCEVTIDQTSIGPLIDGLFYIGVPCEVKFTVKAPEGKVFPVLKAWNIDKWLCDFKITGCKLMSYEQSADFTELTFTVQTLKATDCLHENVTMKAAGKLATCTEDGVQDKYACSGCGKEFFDAACTKPWNDSIANIPAAGHNFGSVYTVGKDTHFFECKTCGEKKDEAPHDFGTLVGQTNSTCMQNGVKAHYECSACKKLVDENKRETTLEDLKLPVNPVGHSYDFWKEEVPATEENNGEKAHKDCKLCGKHFDASDKEITGFDLIIPKIGSHKVVIGEDKKICEEGTRVTATAKAPPAGKVFKGWKDARGNIVSTEKNYTFTVTGETTLTAVYEDMPEVKPAKNEGLSGGAIAGIVIGSVAVLGVGGFAIYWFVVRKKTFADLVAAIRGTFKKKQ